MKRAALKKARNRPLGRSLAPAASLTSLHGFNQITERLRLLDQFGNGPGGLAHRSRRLTGHVVHVQNGPVDFIAGGGLLLARRGDGADFIGRHFGIAQDFFKGGLGLGCKLRRLFNLFHGIFDGGRTFRRALLDSLDGRPHFLRGFHGFFGQLAHFVRHHGKAARLQWPR